MTTPETTVDHEDRHHDHPSDFDYVKVALVLAVLTGIEVWLSYAGLSDSLTLVSLLVFAVIKFAIVALYFMHLKLDNRVLRWLFVTGLVLAVLIYVAYLLTLGVFID